MVPMGDIICDPPCNNNLIAFIHWDLLNVTFEASTSKVYNSLKFITAH